MTSRYYCGDQPLASGQRLDLPSDESRHLLKTMRGRIGDLVVVFGGQKQFSAELITADNGTAGILLHEEIPTPAIPQVQMSFLVPWIKGGKTDFLIQKLTELGAFRVIIFQARREVARGDESKVDRLSRIALEACKQCERVTVPIIEIAKSLGHGFQMLTDIPASNRFVLHEREGTTLLSSAFHNLGDLPPAVAFASGPEGGWHPDEVAEVAKDVTFVSLGPRILRAETAPIAAAAAVLALSGDL